MNIIVCDINSLKNNIKIDRTNDKSIKQISKNDTLKYIIKMLRIANVKEFTFAETNCHMIIQLNIEKRYWRVCKPFELFG